MMHINLKIAALGDPPNFPEFREAVEVDIVGVSIIEKGMESGNCAAAIFFRTREPDITRAEGVFVAQLSASMLMTLGSAAKGAKERFHDDDV